MKPLLLAETFVNTLGNFFGNWWGWFAWGALAALLPALIVLLYFLKLKRQPLEVPSTYLWSRTIEDLHVNTIWQRLRQNLLLFLQLLILALALFALLRPGWQGEKLVGDRFIFLVDASASMSAADIAPSRLADAKRQARALVDQMESGDQAMVISFSDGAKVEQSYTNVRSRLHGAIESIQQTERLSDLNEALRAAAGLANPGRTGNPDDPQDVVVAEGKAATMYMFSDGGFPVVPEFSLGNLTPVYVPIGADQPKNVAVAAFNAERNPERPDQTQAFARLVNFNEEPLSVEVELLLDGEMVDYKSVDLPETKPAADGMAAEYGESGVQFDISGVVSASLELAVRHNDDLLLDNRAYLAINEPRPAKVLLVSLGNKPLEFALRTESVGKVAEVSIASPSVLPAEDAPKSSLTEEQRNYETAAISGAYDMVIYDRCSPREMPQCNTMFIGAVPPLETWKRGPEMEAPVIIDLDRTHPLMQLVVLDNVIILSAFKVTPPSGGLALIDAAVGPIAAVGPRQGFEDVVLGFDILSAGENGEIEPNTDWVKRFSFPLFMQNALRYLGGSHGALTAPATHPGQPIALKFDSLTPRIYVQPPQSRLLEPVSREGQSAFVYSGAERQGLYRVREKPSLSADALGNFAVNLFNTRESDLAVQEEITIEHKIVPGERNWQAARRELWKWLLLLGLVVLMIEWYVYNKRVYL